MQREPILFTAKAGVIHNRDMELSRQHVDLTAEAVGRPLRHALSPWRADIAKQARNPYERYGISQRMPDILEQDAPKVPSPSSTSTTACPRTREYL
ncbi:hypothetical protein BerOc1_00307 [Pseudodesulfovibrio hydrargyri]|uniref:Uncharacterized protein n=2 Tax=Pseudodesulfovibrio hydrargyri TaxID=2125990 RepID=A0A1J5N149_9BACT|nr:hypothetical protein BerOc1_00307 [Pseudodesulfovibrio hydrargyri]